MPSTEQASENFADGALGRPSSIRHLVVLACALMAVLLYLDRYCVGLAEPYIKQDLGLTTFQVGIFFSAFFLTYALFQVPAGWLSDRYGGRLMLTLYILTWSVFTGMMGLAYGFGMLLLVRAAYGIGQAGAYPTSANVISKWVPFSRRGTASSIVALGGRFGGAIAPALTAFLIVLCVPVESRSLFEDEELLDAAALSSRLSPMASPQPDGGQQPGVTRRSNATVPARPPAIQHVWSLLSPEVQARVTDLAQQYRPLERRRRALEKEAKSLQQRWRLLAAKRKSEQAASLKFDVDVDDRGLLVKALNSLVENDDFFEETVFDGLKNVDRAALQYMKRLRNSETLSADETRRFNRLLLEACFPEALGKVYVSGWRPVMIVYGLAGLFVGGFFWVVLRNRPEEHPRCNEAEQAFIAAGRPPDAPGPHGKAGRIPWARLLKSRSLWFSCLSQVGTNVGWVFLVTWFPRYLLEQHGVPILERGMMASTPLFVGWLGMLSGGAMTDKLVKHVGLRWGRRLPWSVSRFVAMAAFLACPWLDSPWAVTAALALVAFSTDIGTASVWAFNQDVGGRYVGSILGWGNMWGNLGATISPVLLAWVFESQGWTEMFAVCAGAYLAAGVFALGIDATIPVAPPDEDEEQDIVLEEGKD